MRSLLLVFALALGGCVPEFEQPLPSGGTPSPLAKVLPGSWRIVDTSGKGKEIRATEKVERFQIVAQPDGSLTSVETRKDGTKRGFEWRPVVAGPHEYVCIGAQPDPKTWMIFRATWDAKTKKLTLESFSEAALAPLVQSGMMAGTVDKGHVRVTESGEKVAAMLASGSVAVVSALVLQKAGR